MQAPSRRRSQIGFHNAKLVKKLFVERKNNDIINRLNKTRTEPQVDLRAEREAYDKQMQVGAEEARGAESGRKDDMFVIYTLRSSRRWSARRRSVRWSSRGPRRHGSTRRSRRSKNTGYW